MTDLTITSRGDEMTCDAFADRLADYLEGDASAAVRDAMDAHASACDACGSLLADLLLIPQAAAALPPLEPSRDLWAGIAERIDARVLPLESSRGVRRAAAAHPAWRRPALAAAALVLITAGVTHFATKAALRETPAGTTPAPRTAAPVASAQPVAAEPNAEIASTATERDGAPRVASRATAAKSGAGRAAVEGASPLRLASTRAPLADAEPVYDNEIAKLRRIVRQRHSQLDPATVAILEQSMAVIDSAIAQSRAALARDPASGFLATQLNHSLEKKVELLRTAASLPART